MRSNGFLLRVSALLAICLAVFCNYGEAKPKGGDILVVDFSAGTDARGALFSIDKDTGIRTVLSDFGLPAQGPLGNDPFGLAIETSGNILVADYSSSVLFRVDPETGNRTILSNFVDFTQGPTGIWPVSVAIDSAGSILVVDIKTRLVFRVDATTGNRTVVSSFKDATHGPTGRSPFSIEIDKTGNLLVTDQALGLFSVDPVTGTRTLVSSFGDSTQGPLGGGGATGIAIEASGKVIVADQAAGAGDAFNNIGVLFRVDPSTGNRAVLTDFGISQQGALAHFPTGVAVDRSGQILTTALNRAYSADPASLPGLLMKVDPSTGLRTVLSDFGDPSQGPLGNDPFDIDIVPNGVAAAPPVLSVKIEIKLGANDNQINRRSNANILVALLSSTTFDAATADRRTVTFANASPLNIGSGPQDINRDGLPDAVFNFSTQQLDLPDGTTEACLKGTTSSGISFQGCGPVTVK